MFFCNIRLALLLLSSPCLPPFSPAVAASSESSPVPGDHTLSPSPIRRPQRRQKSDAAAGRGGASEESASSAAAEAGEQEVREGAPLRREQSPSPPAARTTPGSDDEDDEWRPQEEARTDSDDGGEEEEEEEQQPAPLPRDTPHSDEDDEEEAPLPQVLATTPQGDGSEFPVLDLDKTKYGFEYLCLPLGKAVCGTDDRVLSGDDIARQSPCCHVTPNRNSVPPSHALPQEAKNRPNIPLQEKFHEGFLRGLGNISDTP